MRISTSFSQLSAIRHGFRSLLPNVRSGHAAEGMAAGFGFASHAAFVADADLLPDPLFLRFDAEQATMRLQSLGHVVDSASVSSAFRKAAAGNSSPLDIVLDATVCGEDLRRFGILFDALDKAMLDDTRIGTKPLDTDSTRWMMEAFAKPEKRNMPVAEFLIEILSEGRILDWHAAIYRAIRPAVRRTADEICAILTRDARGRPAPPSPPVERPYITWLGGGISPGRDVAGLADYGWSERNPPAIRKKALGGLFLFTAWRNMTLKSGDRDISSEMNALVEALRRSDGSTMVMGQHLMISRPMDMGMPEDMPTAPLAWVPASGVYITYHAGCVRFAERDDADPILDALADEHRLHSLHTITSADQFDDALIAIAKGSSDVAVMFLTEDIAPSPHLLHEATQRCLLILFGKSDAVAEFCVLQGSADKRLWLEHGFSGPPISVALPPCTTPGYGGFEAG